MDEAERRRRIDAAYRRAMKAPTAEEARWHFQRMGDLIRARPREEVRRLERKLGIGG